MAGIRHEFSRGPESATRTGARRVFDRTSLSARERADPLAPGLPPELAFLPAAGFSSEQLLDAIGAAPSAIHPVDALLSEGIVREEAYYGALARHLGCQYYRGEPPFARGFDAIKGMRCGVAPLDSRGQGPQAVIAPRAESVSLLMEAFQSGRIRSGSFALTSPQRFASLVRARHGEAILEVALGRLPSLVSARQGMTGGQIAAVGAVAAAACVLGVARFDVLQGVASAALWLIFSAVVVLRSMALIASDAEVQRPTLADDELPVYTVVVALYRETGVVQDLVNAIDAFDYPKNKLDIKLVVERRDLDTLRRLAELRLPARYEVIVAPPGEPRTKPRALNIALSSARGELLVVYDAEDAPSPDQLRLAASRFAADQGIDCLQARLAVRNDDDSWLSKLFAMEYAVLFDLINPGLSALDLPMALGGTSNHFRVGSLINVGAWDEWNVTEDADLGIRLARFGYRVETFDSDTWEEAPHELGNWFAQRVRWQKGWMQTFIVHSRRPMLFIRDLGCQRALAATTLMVGTILTGLLWPAFAADTLWRALSAGQGDLTPWREATDVFVYILALAGVWAMFVPAVVAVKLRRLSVTAGALALLPVYYILLSAATWAAMFHLALWPHHWAKTAHGRARRRTTSVVVRAHNTVQNYS
jgi:cellulose synthase/poly-beta-1,6-N-acetylglucosamine synthase-like glycosyltransferase